MKLLICTQTVDRNDPVLGFFHRWIEEFAKHCEQVLVISLREGAHSLPHNVRVYALGEGNKFMRAVRFLRLVSTLRHRYDSVFVHMNPEYIVLGGLGWRLQHKKITLWYAHKSVTLKLRIATLFATRVCSVTEKSFPISTRKIRAFGHGIDTSLFVYHPHERGEQLRLATAGRIAPSKHVLEMLRLIELLKEEHMRPNLTIAGEAATSEEKAYKAELLREIERRGLQNDVRMVGAIPHAELPTIRTSF